MRDVCQRCHGETSWRIDVSCGGSGHSELRFQEDGAAEVSGGRGCCLWRGRTVAGEPRAGSADTDHTFSVCWALC